MIAHSIAVSNEICQTSFLTTDIAYATIPRMRKLELLLAFAALACAASRPRVRAVTAFIQVDPKNPTASIQDARKFLASAKDALNKAGFEGGGGRITTQAFPLYTKGMTRQGAVAMLQKWVRPHPMGARLYALDRRCCATVTRQRRSMY
jgi:hypothetical protein